MAAVGGAVGGGVQAGNQGGVAELAGPCRQHPVHGLGVPACHQTWMDEDRIADVLKSERMGHEIPGMRGVYSHVSDAMRTELKAALQERWAASLRERAKLAPHSIVPVLDTLLAEQSPFANKIRSHIAPKNGHESAALSPRSR